MDNQPENTGDEAKKFHMQATCLCDEFITQNEGNQSDALLSACQIILKLERDLYVAHQSISFGYCRSL